MGRKRKSLYDTVTLDRQQLLVGFERHVRLLQKSCREFDQGDEDEALRIAGSLRVLLHDGQALLHLLGARPLLWFRDTAGSKPGEISLSGMVVIRATAPRPGLVPPPPRFVAPLNTGDLIKPLKFPHWWNTMTPIRATDGQHFSRAFLVLAMANSQAMHFDPTLDAKYDALTRANFGFKIDGVTPEGDVAAISVRQIAYEVLDTIGSQRGVIWGKSPIPQEIEAALDSPNRCG